MQAYREVRRSNRDHPGAYSAEWPLFDPVEAAGKVTVTEGAAKARIMKFAAQCSDDCARYYELAAL